MNGVRGLIMKTMIITIVSLFFSIFFIFPNLVLFLGIAAAVYNKYIAAIFCLIFTYNIAKLVESKYNKYKEKKNADSTENADNEFGRITESNDRYGYEIVDDNITFTFRNIKDKDGRQLSRLKFMRDKFFKD